MNKWPNSVANLRHTQGAESFLLSDSVVATEIELKRIIFNSLDKVV